MAKYIKKEMPDLNGIGKTGAYYRMETYRNIGAEEFIDKCAKRGGGLQRSALVGALALVTDELAMWLANGYSVTIDGIGTFGTKLGVKRGKLQDTFEEGEQKRNAQSLSVTGISYRADKQLIRKTDQLCDLERGGERRLHQSPYELPRRVEMAKDFIKKNGFMHVYDYATITGLSYTSASLELRKICKNPEWGITWQGRKSSKLYLLAQQ